MKVIKTIAIILAIIIAIPLIMGLFINKDYTVEREIVIVKAHAEVFEYVRLLKNQDNFSKWASMDPHMEKTFRGIDGEVGFISAWESENKDVGKGEQEIIAIQEGERIDYALRFFEPFESSDKAYMLIEPIDENQTKVTWGFEGHMDYPMNNMLLFMNMEEMLGGDFQTGLENLKKILEG